MVPTEPAATAWGLISETADVTALPARVKVTVAFVTSKGVPPMVPLAVFCIAWAVIAKGIPLSIIQSATMIIFRAELRPLPAVREGCFSLGNALWMNARAMINSP
jgi:hypothetical protein